MQQVRRLVLDILKPHHPNSLEFACRLSESCIGQIKVTVKEVDEQTESILVEVAGNDISFNDIQTAITAMGASLHSIDEVEVTNE